jgi:hypothetical protein
MSWEVTAPNLILEKIRADIYINLIMPLSALLSDRSAAPMSSTNVDSFELPPPDTCVTASTLLDLALSWVLFLIIGPPLGHGTARCSILRPNVGLHCLQI